MPKYRVTIQSMVPRYYNGTVEVEADSEEAAREQAFDLYDEDEIDWDSNETDWDGAKASILGVEKLEE